MALLRKKALNLHDFGEFIGFFAIHFLWQTENHENVVPLLAKKDYGKPSFDRFESEGYSRAAAAASERFDSLKEQYGFILLALDAYVPFKNQKYEAVVIQAHFQDTDSQHSIIFAIPYKWRSNKQHIYTIQVLESDLLDKANFLTDIKKGMATHQDAFAHWQSHLGK